MKTILWTVLRLLCSALLLSCAVINPAPDVQPESAKAAERQMGTPLNIVRIEAHAAEWPGAAPIEQQVTPIRVSIQNNSGRPLRVRYSEYALIGSQNELFSALPLYRIEGATSEFIAPSLGSPGFRHNNFYVAPHLARTYPMIEPYAGKFYYDPMYRAIYTDHWRDTPLPTPDMWENALPEGVLVGGGSLDGWLYFEKADAHESLTFRADLVDADTGRKFGEIRIPVAGSKLKDAQAGKN